MKDKKIIYISHVFQGKRRNAKKVAKIIEKLHKKFPKYIFISPIHNYGMLYKKMTYVEGLLMCIDLLKMCDECWIFGDTLSTGVEAELHYCKNNNIPYKICEPLKYDSNKKILSKKVC